MSNYLEPLDDFIQAFAEVREDVSANACKIISTNNKETEETGSFLQICAGGQPKAKEMVFRKMSADHYAGFGHDMREADCYSKWSDIGEFGDFETTAQYRLNLNLVGVVNAQVVCLGFTSAQGFKAWKKSAEYDYLRYIKPWLKGKVICICASSESVENRIVNDVFFKGLTTTTYTNLVTMMNEGGYQKYFMSEAYDLARCLQEILFFEFGIQPNFEEAPSFVDAMTPVPYVNKDGDLKDLLIGQTEITQSLYESVMGVNPSKFKGSGELPVEKVSWFDLLEFCNRLSEMQGFRPCYSIDGGDVEWDRSANGYRLPTEDEWEYIAKANRTFEYSGSDAPGAIAWYENNSGRRTHDVGTKKENSFGTYDQSGNLSEWCWDRYSPKSANRVLRGGSWGSSASFMRAAYRSDIDPPSVQSINFGGRLARSPDPLIP